MFKCEMGAKRGGGGGGGEGYRIWIVNENVYKAQRLGCYARHENEVLYTTVAHIRLYFVAFGISSKLWDIPFGTIMPSRDERARRSN